jgi:hypothetical protein
LCWAEISLAPSAEPVGWKDEEDWLCPQCFAAYVEPRENAAP